MSAAEAPKKEVKETVLKTVQLDGQVVLKIVKHCTDAAPQLVTGQLLGLDVGQTLEVTDCFPFPVRAARAAPRARPISAARSR
jgi:translation initiation factor 3 subunit H